MSDSFSQHDKQVVETIIGSIRKRRNLFVRLGKAIKELHDEGEKIVKGYPNHEGIGNAMMSQSDQAMSLLADTIQVHSSLVTVMLSALHEKVKRMDADTFASFSKKVMGLQIRLEDVK